MRVLIACEFSGVVREAFKAKGHDAWSCDLINSDINGDHLTGDVIKYLTHQSWDLLIAHPPCTYLSNAGARFLYPQGVLNEDRLKLGILARDLFMDLYKAPIAKICIENPVPSSVFCLPKYDQVIQPYYFGDMVQKKTCLWLRGLPNLKYDKPTEKPQSTKIAGNWFNKGGKERQKNRARTFQGIAKAMAEQWGLTPSILEN